jgi:hypothetical protein
LHESAHQCRPTARSSTDRNRLKRTKHEKHAKLRQTKQLTALCFTLTSSFAMSSKGRSLSCGTYATSYAPSPSVSTSTCIGTITDSAQQDNDIILRWGVLGRHYF